MHVVYASLFLFFLACAVPAPTPFFASTPSLAPWTLEIEESRQGFLTYRAANLTHVFPSLSSILHDPLRFGSLPHTSVLSRACMICMGSHLNSQTCHDGKTIRSFFYIPDAALSAVIMVAVATLVSPPSVFYQFFKINLWDFLSSQIALWVTIFVSVETGIATGVGFSLLVLLYRVARPNFHVLRQLKDRPEVFVDESVTNSFETVAAPHGVLVFRIEESTTFPNTEAFKTWVVDECYKYTRFGGVVKPISERLWSDDLEVHIRKLRQIAHGKESNITDDDLPRLRAVILDFSAVNNIDSTGLQGLFDLRELLRDYAGVDQEAPENQRKFFEMHFVGIQANVLRVLELSGITRPVGPIALQKVEVLDDGHSHMATSTPQTPTGEHLQNLDNSGFEDVRETKEFRVDTSRAEPAPGDIGAGALSLNGLGSSPFLKGDGLVHLTVRDAVDSVLIRASHWDDDAESTPEFSGSTMVQVTSNRSEELESDSRDSAERQV